MWIADGWEDYELLDCGGGEKLERWGKQILVRPDPQAIWETPRTNRGWRNAQGRYYRSSSGGGHWDKEKLPESWTVNYKDLKFQVKPMNFKHTGLFPEQAVNWDFAREKIKNAGRPVRVLNLFAYTGGATVACAAAGAQVCHVDAAKGMVNWARENARVSGLSDAPVRWIIDDCAKFVEREIRRGKVYDAIIMDPPSYGRGPGGEVWKLEDNLFPVCEALRAGLIGQAAFCHHQLVYDGARSLGARLHAAPARCGKVRRQGHVGRAGPARDGDGARAALRRDGPLVLGIKESAALRR